jgi:DivIVA domain-containing protein
MGAKEIMARKFEMVLRGYKTEEVEEFLREVSLDFSRLQKENDELEKKLEVLANKIREYREDEDTLKDALLGAQRQGNALIADSKRKAAEIIEDTENKRDAMLKKAEEDRQALQDRGEAQIKSAQEEAKDIIDKANWKAAEIEREMNMRTDVQKEILHRTSTEIEQFKQRVLSEYKKHIDSVEKIAETCENQFITEIQECYTGEPKLAELEPKHAETKSKVQGKRSKAKKTVENFFETATVPADTASAGNTAETALPLPAGIPIGSKVAQEIAAAAVQENAAIKFEIDMQEDSADITGTTTLEDVLAASGISEQYPPDFTNGEFAMTMDFSDDEVIAMNLDTAAEKSSDEIFESVGEVIGGNDDPQVGGDTAEVPLFKSKSDDKATGDIFFKKSKGSAGKSKLTFSGKE